MLRKNSSTIQETKKDKQTNTLRFLFITSAEYISFASFLIIFSHFSFRNIRKRYATEEILSCKVCLCDAKHKTSGKCLLRDASLRRARFWRQVGNHRAKPLCATQMGSRRAKYVWNRATPEGSLVEAWVTYESLTICAMYLQDVEIAFNRPQRNNDSGVRKEKLSVFAQIARPFGDPVKGESFTKKGHGGSALVHTQQLWRGFAIPWKAWKVDEAGTSFTFICQVAPWIVSFVVSRTCKLYVFWIEHIFQLVHARL